MTEPVTPWAEWCRSAVGRFVRWLTRGLVSDDPWYDWADRRLDELERRGRP